MQPDLTSFVDHLRAVRKSPLTIRRYGDILSELDAFAKGASPASITRATLQRFASAPRVDGRTRSAAGVNLRVAVLRAAWRFLVAEGLAPTNPAAQLVGVPEPRRTPKFLTTAEICRLVLHVAGKQGELAARNTAIVIALWQTALRVSELARLRVDQLDRDARVLRDVRVKGGHVFDVAVNDETLFVLARYLDERGDVGSDAPLFARGDGRRLSVRAIQALFSRWREELGWTRALHPHVLRHTHATGALAAGVDIATIAELLRHEGLRTVMVYARVQDTARREALTKLGRLVPASVLARGADAADAPPGSRPTRPNNVRAQENGPCVEEPFDAAA